MSVKFTKMHGLGNDYLFVDARNEPLSDPVSAARALSDRHRGIGSDGLILVLEAEGDTAHARMQMFNADGSEAEMCGNGIRCMAKYLVDREISIACPLLIETQAGELALEWSLGSDGTVQDVTVSMGAPILECGRIPARLDGIAPEQRVIDHEIELAEFGFDPASILRGGVEPLLSLVSMGNPHAILYCTDIDLVDLAVAGEVFEHHSAFPNRINVHLVEVSTPAKIRMRSWERGSGLTQACGTGACAACVAGVLSRRHERSITATLPGGDLRLEWASEDAPVRMSGPAVEVFQGEADAQTLLDRGAGR